MYRTDTMRRVVGLAKEADARGDVTMRSQHALTWRELATDAQARRAPRYLTWPGRKT